MKLQTIGTQLLQYICYPVLVFIQKQGRYRDKWRQYSPDLKCLSDFKCTRARLMENQANRVSAHCSRMARILQSRYSTNLDPGPVTHIRIIRVFWPLWGA